MEGNEHDSLFVLLKEVQLEHFYHAIKSIDVTKVEHFENVHFEDLTSSQVGMGAPAARRLLEAAKKRNNKWKKNIFNIILPVKPKDRDDRHHDEKNNNGTCELGANGENAGLTCLISNDDIKLLNKIGDGSFGVVMRAQWVQANKSVKEVAVKILKQDVLLRALEDFAKEVNSMHQLRHANLIRLHGIVLSSPMMMVTELAEQGSLRAKLVKTLGKLSLTLLVYYAVQISCGMEYLESKRLIHRDLATRNIFITGTNTIKIGDFGLMRTVPFNEDYYTMSDNMKVPFPWCAIESLKFRQFSHASDTWMFGVTLWEIFSFGQEPWAGLNGSQIIQKLDLDERLPMPEACSSRIYQAMNMCWKREPKDRPTFSSLMQFFKSSKPVRLKSVAEFDSGSSKFHQLSSEKKYLKILIGDEIDVIEGKPENYWWKGQSQRTLDIGFFPRCVAKDLRSLHHLDISKPLKNSFIHTGHMDPLGKKSWGNPEFIEKMYLEHPIEPPDVLGLESDDSSPIQLETRNKKKKPTKLESNPDEDRIAKITSLNELVKKDDFEEEEDTKEGILIDFNNEESLLNAPIQHSPETKLTNLNDLSGLKFEPTSQTKDILDLYNLEVDPEDDYKSVETSPVLSKSLDDKFNLASTLNKNLFSKYYTPPLDSCETQTQLSKGRYYSSVCTNCDCNTEYNTAYNPYGTNTNETMCSCQSCQGMSNNPFATSHQYLVNSNSCVLSYNSSDLCNNEPMIYPTISQASVSTNGNFTANNSNPATFQTQICKDFIEELEANFSRIGRIKTSSEVNGVVGSSPAFPVINPPPRSLKTRRPAPPPPTQKKN